MNKQPFLMRKHIFFLLIILLSGSYVMSQPESEKKEFKLTNSKPLDKDRYNDIKGDPYLFKKQVNASIITNDMITYDNASLNYNGHTKEFEVLQDNEYIELDRKFYLRIEIPADKNEEGIIPEGQEKLVFQKNVHQKFKDRMLIMIHLGKKAMVAKEFHVSISEKEKQDVGKTVVTKRFFRKFNYYIVKNGELSPLKLSRKGLISALGHKSELDSFIKKNKYKADDDSDLREILAYYETL